MNEVEQNEHHAVGEPAGESVTVQMSSEEYNAYTMRPDRGYCESARLQYSALPPCWSWTMTSTPPLCKSDCKLREHIHAVPATLPADPHSRRLAEIRIITNNEVNTSIFLWSEEKISRPSLRATTNYINKQEPRTTTINQEEKAHTPNTIDNSAPASPGQLYQKKKIIKKRPSQTTGVEAAVLPRIIVWRAGESGYNIEQVMTFHKPSTLSRADLYMVIPRIMESDYDSRCHKLILQQPEKYNRRRKRNWIVPRITVWEDTRGRSTSTVTVVLQQPSQYHKNKLKFTTCWKPPAILVHDVAGHVERKRDPPTRVKKPMPPSRHRATIGAHYRSKRRTSGQLAGYNMIRYLRTEDEPLLRAAEWCDIPKKTLKRAVRSGAARLPKLTRKMTKIVHDTLRLVNKEAPVYTSSGEPARVVEVTDDDKYAQAEINPIPKEGEGAEINGLTDGEIEEKRANDENLTADEREHKRARTDDTDLELWSMGDSGANCHVMKDRAAFVTFKSYNTPRTITGATSGDPVLAYGVGTVIIKLKAEKLQNIELTGRARNKPRPANDFIYIQLSGVIWAPSMSRNYIDTTRIRKTPGGMMTMVGDHVGNRIIAGHVSLQYTLEESNGNEFIRCVALSEKSFRSVEGMEVHVVETGVADGEVLGEHYESAKRTRKQRKRLNRAITKLPTDELERIVFAPPEDTKIDKYLRESARIQLSKAGHYSYHDGAHDLILEWHGKLAHASIPTTLRKMREMGLSPKMTRAQKVFCEWCLKHRPRKKPVNRMRSSPTKDVLWGKFFVDVSNEHTPAFGTGNKHCTAFIERHSGLVFSYYHKDCKSMGKILDQFVEDVKPLMEASGQMSANFSLSKNCVHSDNASYFVGINSEFSKGLAKHGIKQVSGAAYTPQHQGLIERWFQTITKRGKALRASAELGSEFWEASWRYAARVYNWLDNGNTIHGKSPMEVATGNKMIEAALELKPFGAKCFVTAPQKGIKKDDVAAFEAIYLGPTSTLGNVWIADRRPQKRGLKIQRHVTVIDEVPQKMADDNIVDVGDERDDEIWLEWDEPAGVPDPWNPPTADTPADNNDNGDEPELPGPNDPAQIPGEYINLDDMSCFELEVWLKSEAHLMGNEIHELSQEPQLTDKVHYSLANALKESDGYREADRIELKNMENNQVWEKRLITELSNHDRKTMGRAHVLRHAKFTGKGGLRRLAKLKSRLVYDGRSQSIEQSGTNTKSCTPRQSTINMHFALAPLCANEVNKSADLTSAFLFAPQHTEDGSASYMRMPFDIREYEMVDGRPVELVHELKKSLYGQRNSPKRFEILFSNWAVNEAGLIRSTVDPCLYYSKSGKLRILQFVDDSHARGCPEEFAEFATLFQKRWGSKFEDCTFYLNTIIARNSDGYYNLSQPAYAKELINKHNMKYGRDASTPLVPGTNVEKEQRAIIKEKSELTEGVSMAKHGITGRDGTKATANMNKNKKGKQPKPRKTAKSERQAQTMTFINPKADEYYASASTDKSDFVDDDALVGPNLTKYKEVLGGISYYANTTRPDLAQSVGMMGQVASAPRMGHWRHLQHMLRYVRKYPNQGLRYTKQKEEDINKLECYVDSSFADGPGGRATTGYAFFMNGGCVSWSSHLQKASSKSTMEAEVAAACTAAEEGKFLHDLLYEMRAPMRTPLGIKHRNRLVFHEDNAACIVFCNNNNVTGKNKKMGRPCNFESEPLHKWTPCIDCTLSKTGKCLNSHDARHCIDLPSAARHVRQNYREVRTMIEDGEAVMIKCGTDDMIADALTKALGPITFVKHMNKLTGYIAPISRQSKPNTMAEEERLKEAMRKLPQAVNSVMKGKPDTRRLTAQQLINKNKNKTKQQHKRSQNSKRKW